ncbi:MAG: preprotein translocase subunit SecY [Eubacteriales bacterium]|nr:preprotein translocase subunit SecY [Eubacteriales bacterium]
MLQTLRSAIKIPELRRKMLFTVFIMVLYRIGAVVPVPYVSSDVLGYLMSQGEGSIFQYLNILSGDAFSKATLFALSISPYITASIVMQLLTIAIPALEKLQKSGEEGKKKITQITRYVTVALGLITAYGYYMYMRNYGVLTDTGVFAAIVIIACYSAGTALIMWLAEKINESGIGNGISLILFANIVSSGPQIISVLISFITSPTLRSWGTVIAEVIVIVALAIVVFVVFITNSERRLPIQYAKKVVGRKMYGGQSTHLPLKLNMSGVMPIIFANSIVALPSTIALLFARPAEGSFWDKVQRFFSHTSWFYALLFFILIIAFSYFYIAISFNPIEVANNLKKNGGFIPGIRPGKPTSDYITKVLGRITLIGALFLGFIAVFPLVVNMTTGSALGSIAFGGSSLLIVIGVALETYREIEAQMTMRHYKGFLE